MDNFPRSPIMTSENACAYCWGHDSQQQRLDKFDVAYSCHVDLGSRLELDYVGHELTKNSA